MGNRLPLLDLICAFAAAEAGFLGLRIRHALEAVPRLRISFYGCRAVLMRITLRQPGCECGGSANAHPCSLSFSRDLFSSRNFLISSAAPRRRFHCS